MRRLIWSVYKEILVLVRDAAGMAILFLLPTFMVFIITLVQDSAINTVNENKLPLLLVNNDKDSLSFAIIKGIESSGSFNVYEDIDGVKPTIESAKNAVAKGTFQVGVIIPAGSTDTMNKNCDNIVKKSFYDIGMSKEPVIDTVYDSVNISILFDPTIRTSVKNSITLAINQSATKIEAKKVYQAFSHYMNQMLPPGKHFEVDYPEVIHYKQEYASAKITTIKPNSVQHNVPAWAIFAMFFIVIPLSGSMIKEKEDGTILRLITLPSSYTTIFLGKIVVYFFVCIIQFFILALIGIYLLPYLGMPSLNLGQHFDALLLILSATALAAISFGITVGSIATTHQQAASFGSVFTIILAALGGLWVPAYLMPKAMQGFSHLSPLNWSLNGFYDIFLRGADSASIMPNVLKLLAFAVVMTAIAMLYRRFKILK
jgi:ABC-2 type transport system permease protein